MSAPEPHLHGVSTARCRRRTALYFIRYSSRFSPGKAQFRDRADPILLPAYTTSERVPVEYSDRLLLRCGFTPARVRLLVRHTHTWTHFLPGSARGQSPARVGKYSVQLWQSERHTQMHKILACVTEKYGDLDESRCCSKKCFSFYHEPNGRQNVICY